MKALCTLIKELNLLSLTQCLGPKVIAPVPSKGKAKVITEKKTFKDNFFAYDPTTLEWRTPKYPMPDAMGVIAILPFKIKSGSRLAVEKPKVAVDELVMSDEENSSEDELPLSHRNRVD